VRRGRVAIPVIDEESEAAFQLKQSPPTVWKDWGTEFELDPSLYVSTTSYFEAVMAFVSGIAARARLYDVTGSAAVTGSEVVVASTSKTRVRSGALTLTAGARIYRAQIGNGPGGQQTVWSARLMVDE
jgi:hypothetical protein